MTAAQEIKADAMYKALKARVERMEVILRDMHVLDSVKVQAAKARKMLDAMRDAFSSRLWEDTRNAYQAGIEAAETVITFVQQTAIDRTPIPTTPPSKSTNWKRIALFAGGAFALFVILRKR